jgi:hypothetical protein
LFSGERPENKNQRSLREKGVSPVEPGPEGAGEYDAVHLPAGVPDALFGQDGHRSRYQTLEDCRIAGVFPGKRDPADVLSRDF